MCTTLMLLQVFSYYDAPNAQAGMANPAAGGSSLAAGSCCPASGRFGSLPSSEVGSLKTVIAGYQAEGEGYLSVEKNELVTVLGAPDVGVADGAIYSVYVYVRIATEVGCDSSRAGWMPVDLLTQ